MPRVGCSQRIKASALRTSPRLGIHLGLIVELKLVLRERVVQIAFELNTLLGSRVHSRRIAPKIAAAVLFRRVHGRIRVREQGLHRYAVVRIHSDADAGRSMNVDRGDSHRGLQDVHDADRKRRRVVGVAVEVPIRTNSSPPKRATVSAVRTTVNSRRATSWSSSSPARCPKESLMSLKRRDRISTPRGPEVAVGMRDGLLQSIVQQDAIRKTGQ